MRMLSRSALPALLAAAVTFGCATYQEERDTTQPAKLKKSVFAEGPWYMHTTVIDAPYEASFTFIGAAMREMEKVQWDVQENFLYAYRTYEFVTGTDADRKAEGGDRFRGEPVAVFKIEKHFDLWHQYNPVTGEELPVLYEATERPWYEREYVRVDWSSNLIGAGTHVGEEACALFGLISSNPTAYVPSRPGDPQAVYFAERDGQGGWKNHYDLTKTHKLGSIDYIDVVTREVATVDMAKLYGSIYLSDAYECLGYPTIPIGQGMQITYRTSFMKVDQERAAQFEPVYYPDPSFERFGYFRDAQYTYDPERGATDFRGYRLHRFNLWERTKNDDGSVIPIANREVRPIVYYINREAPEAYRKIAVEGIGKENWNRAFADVLQAIGHPLMTGKDAMETPADELPQVFVIRETDLSCGLDGKQPCQQIGDLRYNFASYVDRPSLGSPLGYGPHFTDPETGEVIAAAANFYGPALDTMRGFVGDLYDLIKGNFSENEIMNGEAVRQYFQGLDAGAVLPPTFPIFQMDAAETEAQLEDWLDRNANRLEMVRPTLETLKRDGPGSPYSMKSLAGTPIEKMLVQADGGSMLTGMQLDDPTLLEDEAFLAKFSPYRKGGFGKVFADREMFWARGGRWDEEGVAKNGCMVFADSFTDVAMARMIAVAEEWHREHGNAEPTKQDVIDYIMLQTYKGVEEHEIGHTVGLRHNFEGTYDEENYHDAYWRIVNAPPSADLPECEAIAGRPDLKDPSLEDYDFDDDGRWENTELQAWQDDRIQVKRCREASGIDFYTYSSIMDYAMHFYYNDLQGLGKYDRAAIKFGYAGTVEAYRDPNDKGDTKDNRVDVPYFLGGERCTISTECPRFDPAGSFTVNGRSYTQHCRLAVTHDGDDQAIGTGVAVDDEATRNAHAVDGRPRWGVCSGVYTELQLGEFVGWEPTQPALAVAQPNFRFCSDDRVGDRPFCTLYDEGKTAVEVVENQIEEYERTYIFNAFRRYRHGFSTYGYANRLQRYFRPITKIYQSMLYQYYYTPGFRNDREKGFTDFLRASIVGMNFFAKVLATPSVGSYYNWQNPGDPPLWEPAWGELYDENLNLYVPPGAGKYLWTAFEQGYYGSIQRYARIGTYYDKLYAIDALATRYFGGPQANDETFPISFYDGFPTELLTLFGGMVAEDVKNYGPAVSLVPAPGQPQNGRLNEVKRVKYRNIWQGGFFGNEDFGDTSIGQQAAAFPDDPDFVVVDPGGSFNVRLNALIYALDAFPVFYDNTFPGYVALRVLKDGEARVPPEDPTTISHRSPKYKKEYFATQTDDGKSFTWAMVKRANDLDALREWYADPSVDPVAFETSTRCQLYGVDGEECREVLIDWVDGEIESSETMLTWTANLLDWMGVQ